MGLIVRPRLLALFALFLVMIVAIARTAEANAPAPFSRPTGALPGVVVERASPIVVERENLLIDCAGAAETSPQHPSCTFSATYFLHNPSTTTTEEEVLGAFYSADRAAKYGPNGETPPPITIRLDGKDAHSEATPEQLERMDAIVREDSAIASMIDDKEKGLELRRVPFRVTLASGQRASLVFEGTLAATDYWTDAPREGYAFQAIITRHPFLSKSTGREWDSSTDDFVYLISPITHWAGDPEVHVSVRHLALNAFISEPKGSRFTTTADDGGSKRVVAESTTIRASSRQNLRFRLAYTAPLFHHGGPVVGIGPRIGREELRLRFGYEIGISSSLILGAAADTNFDNYVTAAATLDAATPSFIFIIPSLSVGVGMPVQFRKDAATRVGVRTQVGLSFPFVSVLFPIDYYVIENSSGSHVEGSFLTQLSF